jgi:release factor glutamine methyltransferase
MPLLSTLLPALRTQLAPTQEWGEDPTRLARRLITHIIGLDPGAQLANPDHIITDDQAARISAAAARLATGEPLSRITGTREFYGLNFALSPATLDPRPETELIVRVALDHRDQLHAAAQGRGETPEPLRLLDLGTGTGCIAIAILYHAPEMQAVAIDQAPAALLTARANAAAHGVDGRIRFLESDWFSALPMDERFDIITSNPPYIPDFVIPTLAPGVRLYDPILALSGGQTGLDAYEKIMAAAPTRLRSGGILVVEIGQGQAADVTRLAIKYGLDAATPIVDDAGIDRVLILKKAGKNKVDSGA